jgi:signal transduction histidine kinase
MPLARALRSRLQIWAQRNKSSCHVPPCKSLLVVPLLIKGQTIGLFYLMHTAPDYYSQIQLELAQVFCDQLAVALEHQRLYQQAQQLAVLEERNRLGRELHDSTSQVLSSILLMAETGRNLLQQNATAQLPHVLDSIFSLAEGGLEEIRALIFELRPDRLAKMGLLAALSGEANALRLRYGLEVVCELGKREPELSLEMKEGLYRVAREALHNVVKHAGASRVEISLTSQKARSGAKPKICLQIRDNGQGFEMNKVPPGHFGLQTMRERVLRLGGELEIASKPGQGTLVQVTIPYD